MAQYNNEHLTDAQISAYLDKELAEDELALCDAHLIDCQSCQKMLADLRLTSTFLRAMPQVEVPRSFALPLNIAVLPQTPDHILTPKGPQQARPARILLRRSLRVLSTLAAIVGLLFVVVGALSSLPHGGASSSNSAVTSAPAYQHQATALNTPPINNHMSPDVQASAAQTPSKSADGTSTPVSTPMPQVSTPTPQASVSGQAMPSSQPPVILDPGLPQGQFFIGVLLFLLSILGFTIAHRFRTTL